MKRILPVVLLSLPLRVLAADLKIEDFKGQFARLTENSKCLDKIVVETYQNRLRIYDLTSGSQILNREIHNEKVRMGDVLIEGSITDKILTEKRYKLKRAVGVVLDKKLISEVKVFRTQDSLQIEDGSLTCHFAVDLPEITPPVKHDDKPIVIKEEPVKAPEGENLGILEPASTKHIALKPHFKDADELLDVSRAEEILKVINNIKSATDKYQIELNDLIGKKESLSAQEIILALKLPYFTAEDSKAIALKLKEVQADEKPSDKLIKILTQNANVAAYYGGAHQQSLASHIDKKVEAITVDEMQSILEIMFANNSEILAGRLIAKIKDISLEDKKSLIPALEEVAATSLASNIAIEIIRGELKGFSTDELLSNSLSLKAETLVRVVETLGKEVSDPSLENFHKLAVLLKNSAGPLSSLAKVFLVKIPVTLPQDILSMVSKLSNGYYDHEAYKDDFLLAAAAQVAPLTISDADQMLKKMGYDNKRGQLFDKLISRLTEELTVSGFELLVKNVKNGYYDHEQYRDQSLLKHYAKISQTESSDNLKLLDLLSSHASRKNLALGMLGRDKTKTLADVVAISLKVNNGYYDHEDYRDQVLSEGVKSLTSLSVAEMKLLLDTITANGKRLNQLKLNVNKLPTLTVDDVKVLISNISNGYYDHENYKDQAILSMLPKTIIATQTDITNLMAVSLAKTTKRSILAVGLKLTLTASELTILISKEADSTIKLEMIKGLAPKISPLQAKEIVALIATVQNGYYDHENMKFQALNFLLDHVKLSQVSELKLIMEQRTDAVSRLAIHKKLKMQLGAVTAENLLVIADLIANGYYDHEQYKDDLILSESKLITSLTKEELIKLTDKVASSAKDKVLITQITPKLLVLSDTDLAELLNKIQNGYYDHEQHRDDTAVALSPIVKTVSTDGINTVIKTIGGHAKRKKVALILLAKKASVSKDDVLSIAQNINNGSYEHESYKTQFLAEAIALIH
ncbi:MAG: hypothetical protein H0V66_12050 [Bdellovibrionales bacterium]|nr:hypothetical protein [Bdellovibrionales bacterium]